MMNEIIGRKAEIAVLKECLQMDCSEFVVVYGRRRVGKTFLIRQTFSNEFTFYVSGLANAKKDAQLSNFCQAISSSFGIDYQFKTNWKDAFRMLSECLKNSTKDEKKVLFIDEMPWMDTLQSGFITGLEWFWNSFASAREDIVLIVCGSATTWMINKLLRNHGGLYGRFTRQILLEPFTLSECEQFFQHYQIKMSRYEQLIAYMIFGGIPYYLRYFKPSLSLDQNVNAICFAPLAPLKNEYTDLYYSLFRSPKKHLAVVTALSNHLYGMKRTDLCKTAKIPDSGNTTKMLEELERCGIIKSFCGFGKKKKDTIFQLIDFFTMFYVGFMKNRSDDENHWLHIINTPVVNTWRGFAFEKVCLVHLPQIKKALGINGIATNISSWHSKEAQIDLVIERADKVVNLCEMKFSSQPYTITTKVAESLQRKEWAFKESTHYRFGLHKTLVSPFGISSNGYIGCVNSVVCMDDLFQSNV